MNNPCCDCLVEEGKLHLDDCDQEICPICKRQLLSCPKHSSKTLKKSEREPFFETAIFICERCGKPAPNMFMTSNAEWEFVCGATYPLDCVLCKKCFDFINNKRMGK